MSLFKINRISDDILIVSSFKPLPRLVIQSIAAFIRPLLLFFTNYDEAALQKETFAIVFARQELISLLSEELNVKPPRYILSYKNNLVLFSETDSAAIKCTGISNKHNLEKNFMALKRTRSARVPKAVKYGSLSETYYTVETMLPGSPICIEQLKFDKLFKGAMRGLADFYESAGEEISHFRDFSSVKAYYESLVPKDHKKLFQSFFEKHVLPLLGRADKYESLEKFFIHGDLTFRNLLKSEEGYYFCDLDRAEYSLMEFDALTLYFDYKLHSGLDPGYEQYVRLITTDICRDGNYKNILFDLYEMYPQSAGNRAHMELIVALFLFRAIAFILSDPDIGKKMNLSMIGELEI